ncbi:hypothetical protein KOW79_009166 [Hemibagrus wyckioides]|uniref:Uncharacterized protein n=1 Tax=Hemibagrus wyckioides TaxID=337641 RepID=A0A9D3SL59_9TELE|nr:hypothetical protein KOW79_009166 [Hemibagrus wyckioides]
MERLLMAEQFVLMKLVNLVGDLVASEVLVAGVFSEVVEEEVVVDMEVTEAMVEKGATVAVVVVVMAVVTVVMEAEIGATAVGKGATVVAAVVATPTGVVATRVVVVEEEDTETTGTRVVMNVLLLAPIETAMTAMLHTSKKSPDSKIIPSLAVLDVLFEDF